MLLMRTSPSPGCLQGLSPHPHHSAPICVSQWLSWPPTHHPLGDTSSCHTSVYLSFKPLIPQEATWPWEARTLVIWHITQVS